jgi:hypothetical protein
MLKQAFFLLSGMHTASYWRSTHYLNIGTLVEDQIIERPQAMPVACPV